MKTGWKHLEVITICIVCLTSNIYVYSQSKLELNSQIRSETIIRLSEMLEDYVYPEVGRKVSNKLIRNLNEGKYDNIKEFNEFARIVTRELYELTNDNHLLIQYAPEDVRAIKNGEGLSGKEREDFFNQQKEVSGRRNYGYKEVRILPGNIGYLRFNEFERAEFASSTAHAAIEFISNTDAIIIDLRNNNGGWGSMVQLLLSYFVDFQDEKNNILLFEKNVPYKNEIIQYRVLPDLPGKRIIETPLYILTSKNTYSAAEAFTDVLQKRNRAIIIGETTRGGAHSTRGPEVLTDYFIVKVPVTEVLNSQTKTNWEGRGIEPNKKTESQQALNTALADIFFKDKRADNHESYLNSLGYSYLNDNILDFAIIIFKENIRCHPKSENCYDSLAEAYLKNGQADEAIDNYKKLLELNPDNENAKEMIKSLKN
ncbi:MAG: tetratricopeptide repeat protein [Bacteroidetes bacterium]|nr:tetratricopeptide repeat protein [Bacteroidota bacterium]MBU1115349.1 tetratricopeptide repeat protein [Bacteroidota bacterium]MBU1800519.1 tetratricopeptide repeat protein [Bacteroidota bacterium]